jgi:hypothetical protein
MLSEKTNGLRKESQISRRCGIVMPISPIDGCSAEHWSEVLTIIKDVIRDSDFEPNLVSDSDEIGIIQKRIIQNLYNSDILVCDVSAKNPNVMFELGIRLAFDKPTIIIKDDHTDYTFDTSVIEHIGYPRDLRFNKIIDFKENLKKKIIGTYEKSRKDPKYSTFLKNFGEYKVAHLEEKEVSSDKYILAALEEIRSEISQLKRRDNVKEANTSKLSSLDALRKKVQEPSLHELVRKLVDAFKSVKGITSDQVYENPLLKHEIEDFVITNLPKTINAKKEAILEMISYELLPF